MKKVFLIPLIAVMALVSQVSAAPCLANGVKVFCDWGADGCWQITDTNEKGEFLGCEVQAGYCGTNLYSGSASPSKPVTCSSLGLTPFTNCSGCWGQAANVVWCDFGGADNCYEKTEEDCKTEGGKNVGTSKSGCGGTANGPFCLWEPSEYNDECYCGVVDGEAANATNCEAEYGTIVTSCTGKCGQAPILSVNPNMGLTVATHGRALHISSDKYATVTLYTLAGQKVLSGSVQAGNKVFSLIGQNPGVYYAVVQSGSYTQTVNVVLK